MLNPPTSISNHPFLFFKSRSLSAFSDPFQDIETGTDAWTRQGRQLCLRHAMVEGKELLGIGRCRVQLSQSLGPTGQTVLGCVGFKMWTLG